MTDSNKEQERDQFHHEDEAARQNDRSPADAQGEFGEQFGTDYGFGREGEHVEEQEVPLNQESDYILRYDPPNYNEVAPVDETVTPPELQLDDQQVIDTIYKRLGDDRQLDPKDIQVDIVEGKAILTGSVRTEELKERAAQITMTVPGVKTVDNQLTASQ